MDESLQKIKNKFNQSVNRYWGDDFDVRYFLITQLKKIQQKSILDIGGGIGIISSELDKSNYITNLDISLDDLKICNNNYGKNLNNLNGSMIFLPFKNNAFDIIICSHILEIAKQLDIKNNNIVKNAINEYPTVNSVFKEMQRVLKNNGKLYVTTPNNIFYKSSKLTYHELTNSIKKYFNQYSLYFYNTYPSFSNKYRKLNLKNIIPKMKLKFINHSTIISSLIKKDQNIERDSISFYVEIRK